MKLGFMQGLMVGTFVASCAVVSIFTLNDMRDHEARNAQRAVSDASVIPTGRLATHIQVSELEARKSTPEESYIALGSARQAASNPPSTIRRDRSPQGELCDQACIKSLSVQLLGQNQISASDLDALRNQRQGFADYLAEDADALKSFKAKIIYASDYEQIDAFLTVAALLPEDQALSLVEEVSHYSTAHKKAAISALSSLSIYSTAAVQDIENIIVTDTDPDMKAAALQALESVEGYDFNPKVWEDLADEYSSTQDPAFKSSILLALAKHDKGDRATLENKVFEGLQSSSADLQVASLDALRYIMSRDRDTDPSEADIGRYQSQILDMANNEDNDIAARIQALNLLQDNF